MRTGALRRAVAAEWGKAVSVRAPWSCLAAALVTSLISAAGLANDVLVSVRSGDLPSSVVVDPAGVLGQSLQLAVVVAGAGLMLLVTAEYSTGSATATFTAQPRRGTVLTAKALVAAALAAVGGAVVAGVTLGVTLAILGDHAARTGPGVTETAARGAVLWAVLALFTVGLATVVRSAVGTLAALVVVLLGLLAVPDPVGRYLPGQAALSFLDPSESSSPATVGLVLVIGWAAALLVTGAAVQSRRDL